MITAESSTSGVATVRLEHGKVNAIRIAVVERLDAALDELERDDSVSAVVLTGAGPFFSFGFDVPHFLGRSRDEFGRFLTDFTSLYTRIFLFPKPVVAAINGHAVAGGWMLAQSCDARIMRNGNVKVGLNEVRFGAALFAGSMAILRHLAGGRVADRVAGSGPFIGPLEALELGLVDELCDPDVLEARTAAFVHERYGEIKQPSFSVIRQRVRGPVVDGYRDREAESIERFLDIWFAPDVQESLRRITIR